MGHRNPAVAGVCFRSPGNVHLERAEDHQDARNWPAPALKNTVRSQSFDRDLSKGGW